MEIIHRLTELLHILTVVFMSWPLYALITVNERGKVKSSLGADVDQYMEGIIKSQTKRCYVFQLTALFTGLALVYFHELGFLAIVTNWILAVKLLILFTLLGLLSLIHFRLQPRIDNLFSRLPENKEEDSKKIAAQIMSLRVKRKQFASFCLFLVLFAIILGVQVFEQYNIFLTLFLVILAILFTLRVYKKVSLMDGYKKYH